jgi:hypothetical protein
MWLSMCHSTYTNDKYLHGVGFAIWVASSRVDLTATSEDLYDEMNQQQLVQRLFQNLHCLW